MIWGPFDIAGKNAVVTGGAMGIGFGIVKRFVEAGTNVLVGDLDGDLAAEKAKDLPGPGFAVAMAADVATPDAGERIVDRCVEEFGSIDILVNSAGIYPLVPMLQMTPELWDTVQSVNLRGLAFVSKAAGARMIQQGEGGKIVNIASIDSFHPSMVGLAAYDASKGGVLMFTRAFALEMAPHGVQVNGIAPGGITTEGASKPLEGSRLTPEEMAETTRQFVARVPVGRMGDPDDIAKVAVFLASSASDYIIGEMIVVDGGRLQT